jgi:hypothetical protein
MWMGMGVGMMIENPNVRAVIRQNVTDGWWWGVYVLTVLLCPIYYGIIYYYVVPYATI